MTIVYRLLKWLFFLTLVSSIIALITGWAFFNRIKDDLPDIDQLNHFEYQIPLRIYSRDHVLIGEFGEKKRIPIMINDVPPQLIHAFLAAEDDQFYSHPGVDYKGLLRAAFQVLTTGKKSQGGSTITMQVTRNFLLSREKTYTRKIKEIILALEIEKQLSKDKILELYLNKIYLGHHAYGIAAAASTYYGKPLNKLNLPQLAMIAGLPKAPSIYNPITNPKRAQIRRDYVLQRMLDQNYISEIDYHKAINSPVTASLFSKRFQSPAPYVAEMIRQIIYDQYGEEAYTRGLNVFSTIDSQLQQSATQALREGLHNYDERHGYRSLPHLNSSNFESNNAIKVGDTQSAQIVQLDTDHAIAKLIDNQLIQIPYDKCKWALQQRKANKISKENISTLFKINDHILVRQTVDKTWTLAQIPDAESAIVALNAKNGAILALSGGFDFFKAKFNHATQAKRQPGSGFKPIIYTTALENGFTPISKINDAPIVINDPQYEGEWRPENYSKKFFGMTSLRTGLRKSRNLISIRLLRELTISKVKDTALRFGFDENQLPNRLSLALGSGHATPIQMASVYAIFANGGFKVTPYVLDRIENNKGEIIFSHTPQTACRQCSLNELNNDKNLAPRIITPQIHFLMNSLLQDVVQRGTATRAKVLNRTDIAGKTGTTNDQRDAWFNGYAGEIVATTWLGHDNAQPLGKNETGGKAALPIWIDFMKKALNNQPEIHPAQPNDIIKAYIDEKSGLLAQPDSETGTWEYFQAKNAPTEFIQTINQDEPEMANDLEEEDDSLF